MKKIAIFVEGTTELEFTAQLVSALVGSRGIEVVFARQWKGKVQIAPSAPSTGVEFYVLIVDCVGDEQVKTQIIDQYPSLVASDYTAIIGLRDVYPFARGEIPAIEANLYKHVKTKPITPRLHLAVMEVEAWFIGEVSHFSRIHPDLTVPSIVSHGFDIADGRGDLWDHPTKTLDGIYQLRESRYIDNKGRKTKSRIQRTINALSFEHIYDTVRPQISGLNDFISSIEQALF